MTEQRLTIAVDFDGTIAQHNDYDPKGIFVEPMPNALECLAKLHELYRIVVYTTRLNSFNNKTRAEKHRNRQLVTEWLDRFGFIKGKHYDDMTGSKIGAEYYVDDHAYHFTNWLVTVWDLTHDTLR